MIVHSVTIVILADLEAQLAASSTETCGAGTKEGLRNMKFI